MGIPSGYHALHAGLVMLNASLTLPIAAIIGVPHCPLALRHLLPLGSAPFGLQQEEIRRLSILSNVHVIFSRDHYRLWFIGILRPIGCVIHRVLLWKRHLIRAIPLVSSQVIHSHAYAAQTQNHSPRFERERRR